MYAKICWGQAVCPFYHRYLTPLIWFYGGCHYRRFHCSKGYSNLASCMHVKVVATLFPDVGQKGYIA